MAKKIYLSPSNQDGNLYSYGGTNEMEQCNRIAQAAEKHLERNGYSVKRAPKGQDMNKSISESNQWGADLHIPIHTNAGGGSGPLVMVYSKASGNVKYAQPIYDALLAICTGKKRIWRAHRHRDDVRELYAGGAERYGGGSGVL